MLLLEEQETNKENKIEDLKVDWSRINFTVWYVKDKPRVEFLFTGFLSPIRKWRRNQAGANILWCLYMSF